MGYRVYIVVTNMKTFKTMRRYKGPVFETIEEAEQYMTKCILKTGKFHNYMHTRDLG